MCVCVCTSVCTPVELNFGCYSSSDAILLNPLWYRVSHLAWSLQVKLGWQFEPRGSTCLSLLLRLHGHIHHTRLPLWCWCWGLNSGTQVGTAKILLSEPFPLLHSAVFFSSSGDSPCQPVLHWFCTAIAWSWSGEEWNCGGDNGNGHWHLLAGVSGPVHLLIFFF